jgi:hypothetical protein
LETQAEPLPFLSFLAQAFDRHSFLPFLASLPPLLGREAGISASQTALVKRPVASLLLLL